MKKLSLAIIASVSLLLIIFYAKNDNMGSIEVGDKVPGFVLQDQNGVHYQVNSEMGKAMVIYFYPKDDTPGCTKEACKFRDDFESFSDLETLVIGISGDSVESHKNFEEKYKLPFVLLSDIKNDNFRSQRGRCLVKKTQGKLVCINFVHAFFILL
jgi:peroxiredoxin Q/BCP